MLLHKQKSVLFVFPFLRLLSVDSYVRLQDLLEALRPLLRSLGEMPEDKPEHTRVPFAEARISGLRFSFASC